MYFVFTTLTSVGFGNVAPNSANEKILAIFVMLLGCKYLQYIASYGLAFAQLERQKEAGTSKLFKQQLVMLLSPLLQ